MSSQRVGTSFVDGLRAPHFVNGRLLTAEDLRAEQQATLQRLAWVGQAGGPGVVEGLLASQVGTTGVQVTAGLGFNLLGQPVRLANAITLSLAPQSDASQPLAEAGRFQNCAFASGDGAATTPSGAYLLTAVPASQLEGAAPVKAAEGSASAPSCASRWEVEGVQFKTIPLAGFSLGTEPAERRRNLLAHWCFGSLALQALALDPFTFDDRFTGLDGVSAADLTPCDLPLAVFHWTGSALTFVDAWAARRRLVHPLPSATWRGLLSEKRVAEGQARFLQFQAQLESLQGAGQTAIRARDHFRFLPPVCFIPIRVPEGTVRTLGQPIIERLAGRIGTGGQRPTAGRTDGGAVAGGSALSFMERLDLSEVINLPEVKATPAIGSFLGGAKGFWRRPRPARGADVRTVADAIRTHADLPAAQAAVGNFDLAQFVRTAADDVLDAVASGLSTVAGFDVDTFFDGLPTADVALVSRETVDFTLQRSWYDEALDLQESPDFNLYLVRELWLREIEVRLGNVIAQRIQALSTLQPLVRFLLALQWRHLVAQDIRTTLRYSVGATLPPIGAPPRLYVIVVKPPPRIEWLEAQER